MSRELNPPREILRRLLFIVCMAGSLVAGIFLFMAFAGRQPDQIFLALLAVGTCILSFFIGHRLFNFSGLTATFPVGREDTGIDEDVRQELEALLHDIDDPDTNWITRHELRKKLANFIQKEPRLLELYGSEIRSAYPFSAGKSLNNDN